MINFFVVFGTLGAATFYMGCFYFSFKYKRPFLYFEIKELASQGNKLAQSLIWVLHFSILFSVLFGILGLSAFM